MKNSTPRFIVMTSSAKMPGSVKSHYRNIAVVETDGEGEPKMISAHARHCVRVVKHYGPQHVGKTSRCAYNVTLEDAQAHANQLNAEG
jgi:hypothetical protein